MYSLKKGLLAVALFALTSFSASAVTIGTYNVANHPDGNQQPPLYGMRLDGLLGYNTYTFDFEDAASNMQLTWDGTELHISGTALGGHDNGSGYATGTTSEWTIDFTFNTGVTQPGGEGGLDDIIVDNSGNHMNFGSITNGTDTFQLRSHSDGSTTFTLGDEDGSGHRGFNGISGWGWLDYSADGTNWYGSDTGKTSDFLFTATVVPVPAAIWLFGSGLIGLIGLARRR